MTIRPAAGIISYASIGRATGSRCIVRMGPQGSDKAETAPGAVTMPREEVSETDAFTMLSKRWQEQFIQSRREEVDFGR